MAIVLIKLSIAVGMISLVLTLEFLRLRSVLSETILTPFFIILAAIIFRVLPFVIFYLILGMPARSDVISYFWPQALHAVQGDVVYRDFPSHYAPLFPYILAIGVYAWSDPRMIVMFMVSVELFALLVTFVVFDDIMSTKMRSYSAILYLVSPAPFILVVLGGQEDVWLWAFASLSLWMLLRRNDFFSGVLSGLGLVFTKALFILPVIPTAVMSSRPRRFIIGFGMVSFITFVPLLFLSGENVLMPLSESTSVSPPNLWFTINALTNGKVPLGNPVLSVVSLISVMVLSLLLVWKYRKLLANRVDLYASIWVLMFSLVMLLSPKSLGNYAAIFLMPLTFLAVLYDDRKALLWTLMLNLLVSVQPSLWYRLGSPSHVGFVFLHNPLDLVEFILEVGMIVVLCVLAYRSWVWLRSSVSVGDGLAG